MPLAGVTSARLMLPLAPLVSGCWGGAGGGGVLVGHGRTRKGAGAGILGWRLSPEQRAGVKPAPRPATGGNDVSEAEGDGSCW